MTDALMVVAIDFGTSYSGYAFSTRNDFQRDPLKIHANQAWNSGKKQLLSLKTPTCLLLDKKREIVSFGYEAEDAYAELVLDDKHHDYYFFERFKMKLFQNKKLDCGMEISDVSGKQIPAIEVFGKSIKALTDHFMRLLETEGIDIKWSEIRWVLTVPAIWSDKAKQVMRESAEQANIPGDNLLIALEPEAAAIYCQYLPKEKLVGTESVLNLSETGVRYMIVDLGGGTTDVAVHQKEETGKIKEICHSNGGDCGGTSIDNAFICFLEKLIGFAIIQKLKKEDPTSYLDLLREFEAIKRKVDVESTGKVNLCVPFSTLNSMCQKRRGKTLESIIKYSTYKNKVVLRGDKIRLDVDLVKSLFNKSIERIISLVKDMDTRSASLEIPLILLVGGFSECRLIHHALKQAFPAKKVIVPEEAGMSVLKGAVLYGHHPEFVSSRVMRYTYGTDIYVDFNPDIHEESRKESMKGKDKCEVFDFIIKQNSQAVIGSEIQRYYFTMYPYQTAMPITIYVSNKENPKHVDEDGCSKIGEVVVDIPRPSEEERSVVVNFVFGKTEINVTAQELKYGSKCETHLNLL